MAKTTAGFEVHEHYFVSGPRANGGCYGRDGKWMKSSFSHSHEGGDQLHSHDDTGPAAYTIDKDEWAERTGLRGGGRKKFTVKPSGLPLPVRELEDWQKTFEIIIAAPTPPEWGNGPGIALPMRLILGSKMKVSRVRGSGGAV